MDIMNISAATWLLDIAKDDLLKCWQYWALLCTWYAERNKDISESKAAFELYQKLFHSRRVYRLCMSMVFLPRLCELVGEVRKNWSLQKVFSLLGKLCLVFFYLFDNVAVVMMLTGNPYYRAVRRLSYSTLLVGIVWKILSTAIELRASFNAETNLKKGLDERTPADILNLIAKIDAQRNLLLIKFLYLIADLLPTLARTNLPQILLRTKINKGTVGVFGIVASLTSISLRITHTQS